MAQDNPASAAPVRSPMEAAAAASAQPAAPETHLWTGRTSWRHYVGRITLWLLISVGLGILTGWIASRNDSLNARGAGWIIVAIVVLSALILLLPVALHILGRKYRLTSQRLFIETGILSKTIDQTELIRVDDVRVHKTLFDRIFNLGTITLLSTDVSNREVIIEGVAGPDAVAEAVRTHMRAQRGKALFVENL